MRRALAAVLLSLFAMLGASPMPGLAESARFEPVSVADPAIIRPVDPAHAPVINPGDDPNPQQQWQLRQALPTVLAISGVIVALFIVAVAVTVVLMRRQQPRGQS